MRIPFIQHVRAACLLGMTLIVTQSHAQSAASNAPRPADNLHPNSLWVASDWSDLPGAFDGNLQGALSAWLASCARPQPAWALVCKELQALKTKDTEVFRIWLMSHLQPYRVESSNSRIGLLTGYYEPIFNAQRTPSLAYRYPLFRLPSALEKNKSLVWLSRQEMAQPQNHSRIQHLPIAYLDNAMDVLALQIQGSGLLDLQDEQIDSVSKRIRVAFAGSNNHPYKSVGAWLRDTHGVRELTWPAIKSWAIAHPELENDLLWSNPRVVFFKEEPASNDGPKGAAGVPLTAGRSIAVDPTSVPYGSPVWISSTSDSQSIQRLVIAQDTGAAITGAVRADYFVGSGSAAGEIAGRLKQALRMWVLWPK